MVRLNGERLAEAIAAGTSRHLGRLLAATNGNAMSEVRNDIIVTGQRLDSPAPAPPAPPIAVDLNPQPIETAAIVTVMYEIVP